MSVDVRLSPLNLSTTQTRTHRCTALVLGVFILVFSLIGVTSFRQKSPTIDEPVHLLSGYSYLKWGDYRANPEHPPLAKLWAAMPLLVLDIKDTRRSSMHWDLVAQFSPHSLHIDGVAADMLYVHNDAETLFFYAKIQMIALAILLGLFVYRWSKELFGLEAAIAALFIYCLDPNILAHSQLVHTDIAFTAMFFIGSYFFWRSLNKLTWANLGLTALFFGLAAITKYAYLVMVVVWGLIGLIRIFNAQPLQCLIGRPRTVANRSQKSALVAAILCWCLIVAYVAIWFAYGFRYDALPGGADHLPMANELPDSLLVRAIVSFLTEHRLFPEAWIYGQLYVFKNLQREAYLLGEYSDHGFWLYFPVAFAVKTPLPTLLLLIGTLASWFTTRRERFTTFFLITPIVHLVSY